MTQLIQFLVSPTGYLFVIAALTIVLSLLFRKEIGKLLDKATKVEFLNGLFKLKTDSKKKRGDKKETAASTTLTNQARRTQVNFGENNKYEGDWKNVSIGGDVIDSENSQKIVNSSNKSAEKK